MNLKLDYNDLINYVSLKKLLQENGFSWSQRAQLVDPQHVWFDGRFVVFFFFFLCFNLALSLIEALRLLIIIEISNYPGE